MALKNITVNLPELYDENIQQLIKDEVVPSRSGCVRTALKEFLVNEHEKLELLGFFRGKKRKKEGDG